MAHEKLAEKLGDYFARLGKGRAHKIKPDDVQKVIVKLRERHAALIEELARKPDHAARITAKISAAEDLLGRAEWLQVQLTQDASAPLRPPGSETVQASAQQDGADQDGSPQDGPSKA